MKKKNEKKKDTMKKKKDYGEETDQGDHMSSAMMARV